MTVLIENHALLLAAVPEPGSGVVSVGHTDGVPVMVAAAHTVMVAVAWHPDELV